MCRPSVHDSLQSSVTSFKGLISLEIKNHTSHRANSSSYGDEKTTYTEHLKSNPFPAQFSFRAFVEQLACLRPRRPQLQEVAYGSFKVVSMVSKGSCDPDDPTVDPPLNAGTFEAIDFGIDEFGSGRSPSSSPRSGQGLVSGQGISQITYIHVHECDHFSIGVFCFPAGATLPLHDHPGMTVFTKLLYGSVYFKSYDWIKVETSSSFRTFGLAGKVFDGVISSPCETRVLFPRSGGNIHSFTAVTPCAILDVLTPPYSDDHGRPSTYFFDFPIPSLPAGYAVLEERDMPEDLFVAGAPYLGPPIQACDDHC